MDAAEAAKARLVAVVAIFAVMAVWEAIWPRLQRDAKRRERWPGNLALVAVSTIVVRLIAPLGAVGAAAFAAERGWGLAPLISLPPLVAGVAAFVLLDMAVYWQHRWFHTLGPLWRLHRVHHADKALDASSGLRFHPVEILMSLGIKAALIIAIGAPPAAVLVFELVLNGAAMFNHANARMPLAIDRWLRLVLVTPDMHRVHHSLRPDETMRNFGFNLPWWDRWFGTYKAEPDAGHDAMVIGLPEFVDEPRTSRLWWMLRSPLQK